ncbi:unnamed protein product [Pleuronectes platessa]|uniref:Uncharacterized protein n=1 Tax=Pleuronectes platessa TaxID=8262 RepID=A0A9N7V898_PLEPL|nr:unnamed protein product [Pleuronectes platessa]
MGDSYHHQTEVKRWRKTEGDQPQCIRLRGPSDITGVIASDMTGIPPSHRRHYCCNCFDRTSRTISNAAPAFIKMKALIPEGAVERDVEELVVVRRRRSRGDEELEESVCTASHCVVLCGSQAMTWLHISPF